ncbi:MAG TPA: SBBP repeat-containing protein [Bacteroidia bacterium]|nr:SBBP repeat-containing protein [Bacteroidia bacterium]
MKKYTLKILVLILFQLSPSILFSQTFQWAVNGGGNSGDYGNSIAVDSAGNSYVTGWFQNNATFGTFTLTSPGGYDIFIVKYDNNGQALWAVRAGGIGTDIGYGIDLDANGNIYVAGTFSGSAAFGSINVTSLNSSPDIFVARYDTSGNVLWVQQAGSTSDDQAQAIAVDKINSKIYVTGYFKGTAAFGSLSVTSAGQSDVFIAKYDTIAAVNSTPVWVHKGGGTGYEIAYGACSDGGGSVYVTGYFAGAAMFDGMPVTSSGNDDVFVVKYNSQGIIQWAHRDGGTLLDRGIAVASSGAGIYYTGWFNGTASFGTTNLNSTGNDEIFIAKLDTSGNHQWAKMAGGLGYDQGYGICTDASGNVYVTGAYDSVATFNTTTLVSAGSWDVFVARYDAAGNYQWVLSGGSPASNTFERDIGYSIKPDGAQNLYAAGVIRNTATFGSSVLTSFGIQDVFVTKISLLTSMNESAGEDDLIIFPNPARSEFKVQSSKFKVAVVEVYDVLGERVIYLTLNPRLASPSSGVTSPAGEGIRVDVSSLSEGIYFVRVTSEKESVSKKIIVAK